MGRPIKIYRDNGLLYLLFFIFIITEIFDEFLDRIFEIHSFFHSTLQLLLFIMLFFTASRMFHLFYKRKIDRLLPEEMMFILKVIKDAENNGLLVNRQKLMTKLNITKPTLKKRLDSLKDLDYIFFEEEGNNKYIKLSSLGDSIIR